jgi:hypothetical protein
MNEHGFPVDMPIEEILDSYYEIDIKDQELDVVLAMLATVYVERRSNLQSTYAMFSANILMKKFDYLVERVIIKYNEDIKEKISFYNNVVSALITYRKKINTIKKENEEKLKQRMAEQKALELAKSLEVEKEEKVEAKQLKDVVLYKFNEDGVNVDSYASFNEHNLNVDYWVFNGRYEQEKIINVFLENCKSLYALLEVEDGDKQELLYAIQKKFIGKNCFVDFQEFLNQNNIEYGFRNR